MAWFKSFDRLTPFIKAFRPMLARQLDSHVEDIYDEMIRNWEQGNDATGQAWTPLAPQTIRQKGHSTPLIETRQMIESAQYNTDRKRLNAVISIEDEEGKVLTHEYGAPDQGIPARPILKPVEQLAGRDAGKIMSKAFDRSWATASRSGTMTSVGFDR